MEPHQTDLKKNVIKTQSFMSSWGETKLFTVGTEITKG
jgi:hypothetical protein